MNRIYFTLALRNVFRQKLRSAMTLAAITFGVAGLILAGGFVQDIFVQLGEAIVHSQTGHIQVFKRDFMEKGIRQPERFVMKDPQSVAAQIRAVPGVDDVAARLNFAGLLNNGHRDLPIIGEGVEPEKEARLGTFIHITAGRQLSGKDAFAMVAGQGVARSLGLKPGDHVTLVISTAEGALNSLDVELVGVFQSFSKEFDAHAVRIPLAAAQELMATAGANLLVVTLARTDLTDEAAERISSVVDSSTLEIRNWRQLADFYEKTVQLYDRQFGVLQWIILIMVLLSVVNSVNMSVLERKGEFGTLQAMGNRRRTIFALILYENAILGVCGAAAGLVLGVLVAWIVSLIGIPMPPPPNANVGYTATIRIVPEILAHAGAIGFISTTLASLLPAFKLSRIPVVDALRESI